MFLVVTNDIIIGRHEVRQSERRKIVERWLLRCWAIKGSLGICIGANVDANAKRHRFCICVDVENDVGKSDTTLHLRHRHRCRAIKEPLDNYIGTDVGAKWRKNHLTSASALMWMQSGVALHLRYVHRQRCSEGRHHYTFVLSSSFFLPFIVTLPHHSSPSLARKPQKSLTFSSIIASFSSITTITTITIMTLNDIVIRHHQKHNWHVKIIILSIVFVLENDIKVNKVKCFITIRISI